MDIEGRMGKIEAALEAKQKFFFWLKNAKSVGGFVSYWEQELHGPLVPFKWFEDKEAYFLWTLVNDVNFKVLADAQTNRDLHLLIHCSIEGQFRHIAARQADETDLRVSDHLYSRLRRLAEESLSLRAAIAAISQAYLGGEDALFTDMRAELESQISNLHKTAEVFVPLASYVDAEPIKMQGFVPGNPLVDAKTAELENCSRTHTLENRGTRQELNDALKRLCPELSVR